MKITFWPFLSGSCACKLRMSLCFWKMIFMVEDFSFLKNNNHRHKPKQSKNPQGNTGAGNQYGHGSTPKIASAVTL